MTTEHSGTGGTPARRVAVLASSGGNLRSHGGNDPAMLIRDVSRQLDAAGFVLGAVQFVATQASMDGIAQDAPAQLWSLAPSGPEVTAAGTLAEINVRAREQDAELAVQVESGEIDGLILMSADPADTNARTLRAAARLGIPVVGTGGSSIAEAQRMGVNVVSASGTTGTTSTTRAVSYVSGLSKTWDVKYRAALGGSGAGAGPTEEAAWRRISVRGIMVGSIPAFIALALVLALSRIPVLADLTEVFDALIAGLPVVVAAMAARKVSGLDEVGLVAGALAGILSARGGILGGLVGGILAGLLAAYLINRTLSRSFPATTANIVTGALAGLLPGLVVYYLLAPFTSLLGDGVRIAIEAALEFSPLLAGALAGLVMWPAIIGGVYHSVILPLVLLEMGQKGTSFFGAIDMVALVMVSLGITLANVVKPRSSGERALAGSGAGVNFFFGTFVEASYPFMFSDRRIFAVAIACATTGGALVGVLGTEASAYLPAVVAPFIATNPAGMVVAMTVTAALAFALTLLVNVAHLRAEARAGAPVG
ncbi:PTS sugar transporter [Arthrobacter sp. RIT-PI-e]|uniref:PTS sugar transporter n=1 Tax=Arthrobacter sp. RIT-PI-e TaxID=1681197 RepID=UPI000675E3A2|nr:PTS sugar transporter [Arthrobacter sp. RIT-PI-e]KNC17309.1 PTS sugar transporter [Arthrobacter sp. RIT-PI-e]